jgi:hypothetical protein
MPTTEHVIGSARLQRTLTAVAALNNNTNTAR